MNSAPLSIVITGEVDHGKSSVVGGLLIETGTVPQSQIEKVKQICQKSGKEFEPAFLLDAFEEEQNLGITIDISQIHFATAARNYRLIDSPGHRDFLKNMVSGSSAADAALILVDAQSGVTEQTRRHCYLLKLLGIKTAIVLINKIDLFQYAEDSFLKVQADCQAFLNQLGLAVSVFIPLSAKFGVNLSRLSDQTPWYRGPTLLQALDQISFSKAPESAPVRFSVQDVYKTTDRRVIVGRVESGRIEKGAELKIWPSGQKIKVATIEKWNAPQVQRADQSDCVGITLVEEAFVERGKVIAPVPSDSSVTEYFQATIFWMGKERARIGDSFKIKLLTQEMECKIESILGIVDTNSLKQVQMSGDFIDRNEVADVRIRLSSPLFMDVFQEINASGRFVLIQDYRVVGGGIVTQTRAASVMESLKAAKELRHVTESWWRSFLKATSWRLSGFIATYVLVFWFTDNKKMALTIGGVEAFSKILLFFIHERIWNHFSIGKKEIQPVVVWFTGLPCAGKTTLAEKLYEKLKQEGLKVEHLDGDRVRSLFPMSDFSREGRDSHVQRVGFLASKLAQNGVFVVASFVSPFASGRRFVRGICPRFIEVYVSTPLVVCEQRDVKGMYKKARQGKIDHFTGVSDPYEVPSNPEVVINTQELSVEQSVDLILNALKKLEPAAVRRKWTW